MTEVPFLGPAALTVTIKLGAIALNPGGKDDPFPRFGLAGPQALVGLVQYAHAVLVGQAAEQVCGVATTGRGMSTRAVQAEQTRPQILDTAQRLFAELGYDATSLQMIADELGLTKAAVYYHFRAKSDILRAAMQPGIQRLEALLDEAAGIRGRRAGSST